ncbi:unnamed protein product [Brassicogethes aeneus]|uniref:Gelsolin-like domain-containing protein n=1 Tax=Brassicogethes aeneus TaxID=1431903 RepID=A0A9P0BGJ5_BRAAE|nr:unnamed protein product [Brassicogethes aeneus]
MEPAFASSGKKEGIEIWRMENFKPVPYPKNDYGKFFTGDSYIVLKTSRSVKSWDIFFWLGAETTQDESGAAAILSIKLDDQLGGGPIQHREVQDHESNNFLSLFPNGVRYLPGGINSGFTHFKEVKQVRLFQVKGCRNVRIKQVPVSVQSMNQGDCFILDDGSKIMVYVGVRSRITEKIKAINAANSIRDQDHAGKATVEIIDEYSPPSDFDQFFKTLGGGSKDQVSEDSDDDQEFEKNQVNTVALYRVSDASGDLEISKVGERPLSQSMLDSSDCFILDTGVSIFVWIGKRCTANEKKESMATADKFIKSKNYPKWTNVQRIVEGCETGTFTQYFSSWRSREKRLIRSDSSVSDADFEARLIHAQIPASGVRFRTEEIFNFTQRDLYEDDIMLLEHGVKLFVWIGNGADDNEKAKCGSLAKDYAAKLGRRNVTIIHVHQSQEPEEFKKPFPSWSNDLWGKKINYRDLVKN